MSDTGEGGDKNLKKWVMSIVDGPLAISVIHLENNMWIFNECMCRSFSCTNAIYSDSLEFATNIASIYVYVLQRNDFIFSPFFVFFSRTLQILTWWVQRKPGFERKSLDWRRSGKELAFCTMFKNMKKKPKQICQNVHFLVSK